jgi:heptaprenyl diphosphate synthase
VTAEVSFRAPVSEQLAELERRLGRVARDAHPTFGDAAAHLFGSPGKLLRPTLVFLAARFGPNPEGRVIVDLAESLELVHTASLVHDDIVDGAAMRRNIATVNSKWSDDVALIVGDYLFAKAYALAAVLPKPEVIALVAQTVFALCDGELAEITDERVMPTEREYLERIELKTASLYAACCQGAALLADADPEIVARLGSFGTDFGLAFQITDDVLDLVGDTASFGKNVGQDLEQGMPTLPMIYALAQLDGDHADLSRRFVARGKGIDEIRDLIDAVRGTDGVPRARRRAIEFRDRALATLRTLPEIPERRSLEEIAYFATDRDR